MIALAMITPRAKVITSASVFDDGKHLYASMGSITDPIGEKASSTGNGIAVYKFSEGQVSPERFIKIAPQPIASDKK